ncbi:MAG: Plug domain-containing protein, partial [Bacteroidetes bacterium]|nr:Plug domain-containing protein [Bacteroidota bacterium]
MNHLCKRMGGCMAMLCLLQSLLPVAVHAQTGDSAAVLKKVTVSALKKRNLFGAIVPVQSLDRRALQEMNAPSVGDAARYFSGVLVRDYGGAGGLKTVSVRSLGAAHTGILYDGIPVADVQSGQIDLGRFSTSFVQSVGLQQTGATPALQPARAYSYGSLMTVNTMSSGISVLQKNDWQAGLRAGSFGFRQPFAAMQLPVSKRISIG